MVISSPFLFPFKHIKSDKILLEVKEQDAIKLIISLVITGMLIVIPDNAWTQTIRHVHPHNIPPAPGPRAQFLQEQAFCKWESVEIVKAFEENGMEVVDMKPAFTFEPVLPRESTIFFISTFGENAGAFVSSYNTKEDLKNAKNYYAQMNRETLSWWIFEKDNILVLISGKVPEERAKQYEKVLNEIDK